MSMVQEFKAFAMKGNVVDLAVGVVIGGAFGAIVSSLVGDIVMPLIGALTGGIDFSGLHITIGSAAISYGKFIQAAFVFLVIAFVLFIVIKGMNSMKKKEEAKPAGEKIVSDETMLLTEIRDLLKK
jgi:large conductance mechanosensitive channel